MAKPRRGPVPKDAVIKRRMETTRRRDTEPEKILRSTMHRLGLRFRLDQSPLPGLRSRADILFPTERVAVFVDGCFWHACPKHGTLPKNNRRWWEEKLEGNVARDRRVNQTLADAGWIVLRFWEHDDPVAAAKRVWGIVRRQRK